MPHFLKTAQGNKNRKFIGSQLYKENLFTIEIEDGRKEP